jgi:hypothetical protein
LVGGAGRKEKEKAGSIRGGTSSGDQSSQQNHRIKIRFLINNFFFAARTVFTTFPSTSILFVERGTSEQESKAEYSHPSARSGGELKTKTSYGVQVNDLLR